MMDDEGWEARGDQSCLLRGSGSTVLSIPAARLRNLLAFAPPS